MIILIGGSSRAAPKWNCLVCETETSGAFADILRHLNGPQLAGLHGSMKDLICGNTPRVAWCEGCESFIDNNTKETHLQGCAGGMVYALKNNALGALRGVCDCTYHHLIISYINI